MSRSTIRKPAPTPSNLTAFLAHVVDPVTGEHDERKAEALFHAIGAFEADIAAGHVEPPRGARNRSAIVADVLRFLEV